MKKITIIVALLTLGFNTANSQTAFGFETAIDKGDYIIEEIDGITVTITGDPGLELFDLNNQAGTTGNTAVTFNTVTALTFTFNQPVNVTSILPIDINGGSLDYTFTPLGGSNTAVEASLVGGQGPTVALNWIAVTSFTVTSAGAEMGFDNLLVEGGLITPTIFAWETAVENNQQPPGGYETITETIDGITVTVSDGIDRLDNYSLRILSLELGNIPGDLNGATSNVIIGRTTKLVTFTFSQPVGVNSIIAWDADGAFTPETVEDFTFTVTSGEANPEVVINGMAPNEPAHLNWVGVTSFAVTSTGTAYMVFDNLSIYDPAQLSITDAGASQVAVYPNPVENTLYIKNSSDIQSINIYNSLGQLVLQSKIDNIDVSHLLKGMYFLQIHTSSGTETKKIIKR